MAGTSRFKKDFGYYFLGIFVPGLLHATLIPVLKHLLGTEIFGAYSLKFNFLLLLMATLIGGVVQGIIRFRVDAENNTAAFYAQVFYLVRHLLMPVIAVSFLLLYFYFHQTILLSVLFTLCIVGGSLQNALLAIAQSNFQSKFTLASEGIRAATFFTFSIAILYFVKAYPQEALFSCLLLSYLASSYLLAKKNRISLIQILGLFKPKQFSFNTKTFLLYGFPLSLWLAIYYCCTYIDKPLLANSFGLKVQGNYQAMFDIIFRGITGIMSPFPIAVLPILTQSFQQGKRKSITILLRKLISLQLIILVIGVAVYWFLGFDMLSKILVIPFDSDYKLSGLIMIIACMVWQIGILNHKPYKLLKRTDLLIKFMAISLLVFIVCITFIQLMKFDKIYYYALPFLIAGTCYNLLCMGYFKSKKLSLYHFN